MSRPDRSAALRSLRMETLESRQMMAFDIDFDDGILTIVGGDGHDEIHIAGYPGGDLVVSMHDWDADKHEDFDRDFEDIELIRVFGGAGNDYIFSSSSIPMEVYGGDGDDTIQGGDGNDRLFGGSGNDYIYGAGGDDTIDGGDGDDNLMGGLGNDRLLGGRGTNVLRGSSGNDTYLFRSWSGSVDYVQDQEGTDTFDFSRFGSGVTVDLTGHFSAAGSNQQIYFMDGEIENLIGSRYNDKLTGNDLSNVIRGGDGDDILRGGGGFDKLYGEAGHDRLYSEGVDALFGGEGEDIFDNLREFALPYSPNPKPDLYKDWGTP
jgi:Ca2+-binding RTX toxin-like protein